MNMEKKSKEYKLLKNKKVSLLRKYGNDVSRWGEQEKYGNEHMARILSGEIIWEILNIFDDKSRLLVKGIILGYS